MQGQQKAQNKMAEQDSSISVIETETDSQTSRMNLWLQDEG